MPTVARTSVHIEHTSAFSFSMFEHCKPTVLCNNIKYCIKLEMGQNNYHGIFEKSPGKSGNYRTAENTVPRQ